MRSNKRLIIVLVMSLLLTLGSLVPGGVPSSVLAQTSAPELRFTFTVPSTQVLDTGLYLSVGATVRVISASGTWSCQAGNPYGSCPFYGADGGTWVSPPFNNTLPNPPIAGSTYFQLISYGPGSYRVLGSSGSITVQQAGVLKLGMNDTTLSDNAGSLSVTIGVTGGVCKEASVPIKFGYAGELAASDNSNVYYGINFRQEFCWDGSQVWLGRQPQSASYNGPYGNGVLTVSSCSYTRSDALNFKRSDFALSTCDIDVINGAGSSMTTGVSAVGEVSGTVNVPAGQEKFYYSMKMAPNGCVYINGINRSSAVVCLS